MCGGINMGLYVCILYFHPRLQFQTESFANLYYIIWVISTFDKAPTGLQNTNTLMKEIKLALSQYKVLKPGKTVSD